MIKVAIAPTPPNSGYDENTEKNSMRESFGPFFIRTFTYPEGRYAPAREPLTMKLNMNERNKSITTNRCRKRSPIKKTDLNQKKIKKCIFFLVFILSVFSACKKSEVTEINEFTIFLNITNDLLLTKQSADILIHDAEGILIDQFLNIQNRKNYEFIILDKIDPVLLSIVIKDAITNNYRLETFLIKETTHINLAQYVDRNINENKFNIEYGDEEIRGLTAGSSSLTAINTKATFKPRYFPSNELISFIDKSDGKRKVINVLNTQIDEIFLLEDLTKEIIKDSTKYEIEESGWLYSVLYGKRDNIDQNYIRLSDDFNDSNPIKFHFLPSDNISDFALWTEVDGIERFFGSYELFKEFEFEFSKPQIDLVLNEITVKNAEFTSLDGHFFKTKLNNRIASLYTLTWEIQGEIDQKIAFDIPNIDDYLMGIEPDYDPENLKNHSTTIFQTRQSWNYNQFISFEIENIINFNIPSSIDYFSFKH